MNNSNPQGWKECKLGEICCDVSYGYTESASLDPIGPKFLRITDIVPGRVNWETVPYCKISSENRLKYQLQEGDIVIARTGATTGYNYTIKSGDIKHDSVFASYLIRYRVDKEKAEPFFIGHLLTSTVWQGFVEGILGGSAQPGANAKQFADFEILLPTLPEQRAIAAILSSLDDKINLLHRQNKTLEGMAEALWRKMFVEEVDPGWKKVKLGDYGEFRNGINYSRNENGDAEYSILNVRDIVESKYVNVSNFEKIRINVGKATPYLLVKGDIVIVRSASPGESLIVLEEIDNLIHSGFSIRLRCYNKDHSLFLFQFLQSYKKELDIFSDGTTLKNINQEILNNIELIAPEKDAVKEFNERVVCIYNKILLNQGQIRTITRLRDTLLPKLMSSEVRVKEN